MSEPAEGREEEGDVATPSVAAAPEVQPDSSTPGDAGEVQPPPQEGAGEREAESSEKVEDPSSPIESGRVKQESSPGLADVKAPATSEQLPEGTEVLSDKAPAEDEAPISQPEPAQDQAATDEALDTVSGPPQQEDAVPSPPEPEDAVSSPPEQSPEKAVSSPPEQENAVSNPLLQSPDKAISSPPEKEDTVSSPPEPEGAASSPPKQSPEEVVSSPPEQEDAISSPLQQSPDKAILSPPEKEDTLSSPPEQEGAASTKQSPEEVASSPPKQEDAVSEQSSEKVISSQEESITSSSPDKEPPKPSSPVEDRDHVKSVQRPLRSTSAGGTRVSVSFSPVEPHLTEAPTEAETEEGTISERISAPDEPAVKKVEGDLRPDSASLYPTASAVATASPNDAIRAAKDQCFHHPLMIFYVCAHTGVLLDCLTNQQCLLQGHSNPISCTAVSVDRRWLATADCGKDCVLIVWDSFTGIPVRTYFDGVGEGMIVIAISPDSQFIATISAGQNQVVSIWEWTTQSSVPVCQASLGEDYSYQTYLTFHHEDSHQLVSNSDDLVVFYYWKENDLKFYAHPVLDKDFNKNIGRYYQSVFVPRTTLALTGTSEGHCVVWETEGCADEAPHIKRGVKLMKMHDCAITVMTSTTEMIVTGDVEGKIKFFDHELKMVNWYEDTMQYGPLRSISFAHTPNLGILKSRLSLGIQTPKILGEHSYPMESTKHAFPFVVPDYTISTATANIIHYTASGSSPEVVLCEHDAAVTALAAHPFLPRLLTAGYACKIKLWDYENKLVLGTRSFGEPNYIRSVCFDPKGEFISIGFMNGSLVVVDAVTLNDVLDQPFRFSRDAITHICFSHNSAYMATADLDKCVSVYVAQVDNPEKPPWQFLAKYRSHFKKIESLMFGIELDTDCPRLLSLGHDRSLVEYDLANSSKEKLILMSSDRVEQSAIPLAMAWYPPLTTESFILLVNNQYKVKLYNSTTKMCRKTILGPIFGSPLRRVIVLPAPILRDEENQETRRYLAFSTTNKVGLMLLPHDGNPHNSKCMVAHPGKVADITCSYDGKYIFTAGGPDCAVNMWNVNTEALEAASLLGGEELQPFYAMLEGGRDGEFFNELEEYFYYAQIRSEGPDVMTTRKVSTTIPVEEIPFVMRAIGFYPSEQEIEDMMNEVKFSNYVKTHSFVTEVDLETLLKLYINHRPVFGLSPLQVGQAFKVLGSKEKDEKHWSVDRNALLSLLQEKGEHMTEVEIIEYLMTLLGYSDNPEVDGSFTADVIGALEEIPERVSAPLFAEEIIGLSTQDD